MADQVINAIPQSPVANSKEEIRSGEKSFKNGYLIGFLLFLVICLSGGLIYYILKDNGTNLPSDVEKTNIDTEYTTNVDKMENSVTNTNVECPTDTSSQPSATIYPTESLRNEGWGLFFLPEYDFSVEIPEYTITQQIQGDNISSVWKVWHTGGSDIKYNYDNHLHTINIAFYPTYIPAGFGCGAGCVKEDYFTIEIYKNSGSKNLAEVVSAYKGKWLSNYGVNATGSNTTKWNKNVWNFSASQEGGSTVGYLLVNDNYVYEISYFMSNTPVEAYQIAQKVFDSMNFGE